MASATAPAQSTLTLEDRLWKVEQDLMQVARRQYALEAFLKELDRVTHAKPFRIWNDILWTMVLDTRDMLVIHLASWTKGIYGRSGLLSHPGLRSRPGPHVTTISRRSSPLVAGCSRGRIRLAR